MAGTSVGERLQQIKQRMDEACRLSGRDPGSVHLVAVSKLQSAEAIRAAYACGQRDFAENYWQEASDKQNQLHDLADIRWHFIGRMQTNKVKNLPGRFFAIHSVDRIGVAEELERVCAARGIEQNVFMQLNIAGEESKGGAHEDGVALLWNALRICKHLRMLGLMVMPPLASEPDQSRRYFARGREILRSLGTTAGELSMGTSQDFTEAIAEGATWVRVGSEVFGTRERIEV